MDEESVERAITYAHDTGFDEGHECGYEDGYQVGYEDGYQVGRGESEADDAD